MSGDTCSKIGVSIISAVGGVSIITITVSISRFSICGPLATGTPDSGGETGSTE
jgi:hypothetical protein